MDAIKILGSLLKSQMSSGGRGNSDILGSVLGSVLGGGNSGSRGRSGGSSGGGLEDILGGLLGGGNDNQRQDPRQQSGGGGLGSILGSVLGGGSSRSSGSSGGGLEDILGGLLGGGGNSGARSSGGSKDLGKLVMGALNGLAAGQEKPAESNFDASMFDNNDAQKEAELLVRAMINSAKADGEIDKDEQQKILGQLGDVDEEEQRFVQQELKSNLDVRSFINSVPDHLQNQVYAMSLMTIKLDTQDEAGYLHKLAQGFNIPPQQVNQIHEKLNAPKLYS